MLLSKSSLLLMAAILFLNSFNSVPKTPTCFFKSLFSFCIFEISLVMACFFKLLQFFDQVFLSKLHLDLELKKKHVRVHSSPLYLPIYIYIYLKLKAVFSNVGLDLEIIYDNSKVLTPL